MRVFCEKIPRVDMTAAISVAVVAKSLVAKFKTESLPIGMAQVCQNQYRERGQHLHKQHPQEQQKQSGPNN